MVFWVNKFKSVINFSFVWCCDVMTSCHDVTKPDLPISACICARKLILFLFPWFFRSLSSKMLLNFSFVWRLDVMTSCHDVTKPDLPISACMCARKLILFLFPWFFRSLSSKMLLIFHLCDDVTSWCHDVTKPDLLISARRWARELILFLFPWFFRSLSSKIWMIFNFVYVLASWRHVMTSRQYLSSPYSTYWSCSWAIVRFLYNSMLIWDVGIKQIIDTNFASCRQHVTTSRHDVTMWRHAIVWNWSNTSMPSIFTC